MSLGSLVKVEFYIRAAPPKDQASYRIRYELCSVAVVDDTVI